MTGRTAGTPVPYAGAPPVVRTDSLGARISAAFSSRAGGVSRAPYDSLNLGLGIGDDPVAVAANRAALADACGLPASDLAWMRQVHGRHVSYIGAGSSGPPDSADAMFTDVPGLALCVLIADCAPVLVADPAARVVGAAHAGREGLVAGVVPALLESMTAAGASPARMRALIGPAICGGCYEVPDEMQARAAAAVPAAACRTTAGTAGLDIAAGVRAQLAAAGLSWIGADSRCTKESTELFSYRRSGTTGRLAAAIWMLP
ncbi:MAG: peptidoglycan editing factor PgeF [Streptosporangiaceae bacterium]